MSGDAATPAAAPASSSTVDIASSVMASMESGETPPPSDTPSETPVETPAPESPPSPDTPLAEESVKEPPTQTPAVIEPKLSAAAEFLKAQGHTVKRGDGRENWAKVSTIEGMLTRYADAQLVEHVKQSQSVTQERDRYRTDVEEMIADVRGDPRAFLEKVANADPRYRAFLQPQAPPAPAPSDIRLPEPDAEWNGARTWSMKVFQEAVIPHIIQQAKAEAKAEAEQVLRPLKEREETERATSAVRQNVQRQIAEAQSWPGFKEHEADILKALQEDSAKARAEGRKPTLTLEGAHRQVVIPRLSTDRNKMREELLAEMNSTAAKTPTVPRSGETPQKVGPVETRDIAKNVIARLERGGA